MVRSSDSRYAAAGTAPLAWADEKRGVLANFEADDSALSVARRFCSGGRWDRPPLAPPSKGREAPRNIRGGKSPSLFCTFSTGHPGPGLMKSGAYWRISRRTIRRFLLRDRIVMATSGIDPPCVIPAEGQSRSRSTSKSRSRSGAVERLSECGRRDRPPLAPPSKGGELRATFAAGNLPPYSVRFQLATLALG